MRKNVALAQMADNTNAEMILEATGLLLIRRFTVIHSSLSQYVYFVTIKLDAS